MRKLVFVLLVAVAACGGSKSSGVDAAPDSGPPDATPTVTRQDLCGPDGALAQLLLKYVQCNPQLDLLYLQGQLTGTSWSTACNADTGPFLDDGSIALPTYAQLQACLAYITSTQCPDFDAGNVACDLEVGTIADSGACQTTEQCGESSYCMGVTTQACGTCQPRLADGQTCSIDEECLGRACIGTQCGSKGGDNAPCQNQGDCIGQRQCVNNKCTLQTWQLNDACTNLGDCGVLRTDLYCKLSAPGTGQCAQYLAIGDACTPATANAPVSGCDLRTYQWCNGAAVGGAKCAAAKIVQEGQTCSIFTGDECATGLVCSNPLTVPGSTSPGTCYKPAAKDAACGLTGDAPCGLFLGCMNNACEYINVLAGCP